MREGKRSDGRVFLTPPRGNLEMVLKRTPSVATRAYALISHPSSIGFDQSQKRVSSHPDVVIIISIIPRNGGVHGTLRRRQRGNRVLVKEDDQL
jgi:hypothetical protein